MTRMTGPDCAVMCNLINTHTHTHTHTHTPEKVVHNSTVCQNQTYLGHEALRQTHLPIREGVLRLTTSNSTKGVVYLGCHASILGRVVVASAQENLPSLFGRLPVRPMASALLEELNTVATEVKRRKKKGKAGMEGPL